jgi:hypothetical protein
MDFEYKINNIAHSNEIVTSIDYAIDVVEEGYTAGFTGTVAIDNSPIETPIPFSDITEEKALGWLIENTNQAEFEAKAKVKHDLQKQMNSSPVLIKGKPWENNNV